MRLNRNDDEPGNGTLVLLAMVGLFLLAGCDLGHGQQAGPPPVPEVVTVVMEPRRVELTT